MPILTEIRILDTWKILGGGQLQGRGSNLRGQRFWCGGDSWGVSLDAERNIFFDFVANEGGGVLRLVEVALGCDQHEALRWLIVNCGLDDDKLTPTEFAALQRQRREVEAFEERLQADYRRFLRELEARRDELIAHLRVADDPAAELELQILYTRIDDMRRAIADDVDADAAALTIAIVDMIAEAA